MSSGDSEKSDTSGWTAVLLRVMQRGDFLPSNNFAPLAESEPPKDASFWMANPSGETKEQ
jgi:hypothetical protein